MRTILFELNEVPWRVLDWYAGRHPDSTVAKMARHGRTFETHAADMGELHPWVTWPTLHRGVGNDRHGIAHLGQNLLEADREFPTLWELIARSERDVGVMGSMQSYPLPAKRDNYAFYVPDTYAPTAETIPSTLGAFQDGNLKLTKENSRNVKRGIDRKTALSFAATLPRVGVGVGTAAAIGAQLFREGTDRTKLNRRRAVQSMLYFDAFAKAVEKSRPAFATFFSNHVAAAMHRFWAASFREDFSRFDLPENWVRSYRNEIDWAMSVADGFLARLAVIARRHDYRIVLASSMGQAATTAEIRDGYYGIGDIPRFLTEIGIDPNDVRPAMAMAPDISLHLSPAGAERFRAVQPELERALGDLQIDLDARDMLHMRALVPVDPERAPPTVMIGNRCLTLEELGFTFVADQDRVATTAYHIPEGALIAWSPFDERRPLDRTRRAVSALEVAPAVLAAHGVATPDYMVRPSFAL